MGEDNQGHLPGLMKPGSSTNDPNYIIHTRRAVRLHGGRAISQWGRERGANGPWQIFGSGFAKGSLPGQERIDGETVVLASSG